MPFNVYYSTDADSPQLDGTVAGFLNVLKTCLVNGYGSKLAAGWTAPFEATGKLVLRNGAASASRSYFRFVTSGSGFAVRGYDDMTDVDTGSGEFPSLAQLSGNGAYYPLTNFGSAWILVADEKTAIFFYSQSGAANQYVPIYIGDVVPLSPSIGMPVICPAGASYDATNGKYSFFSPASPSSFSATVNGEPVIKSFGVVVSPVYMRAFSGLGMEPDGTVAGNGTFSFSTLGTFVVSPYWLGAWESSVSRYPVAHLRFVRAHGILDSLVSDANTFAGAGALSGVTFRIIKPVRQWRSAGSVFHTTSVAIPLSAID
jgi:hypothetical protein